MPIYRQRGNIRTLNGNVIRESKRQYRVRQETRLILCEVPVLVYEPQEKNDNENSNK